MKSKCYLFVIALLLGANVLKAQLPSKNTYSDFFREGNFLLLEENYDQALKNFLEAYKIDSSSANINFNVGYCYLNSSTKKGLAERYLAKAIFNISKNYKQDEPSEKAASPLAHFYYGRALHINYKFDEAIAQYDLFDQTYAKDKVNKEEVTYYKSQSVYAKEIVAAPVNVQIDNLGDSINSIYPDFSPVLSADEQTIIYTTRRPTSTGADIVGKTPDGQYFEDIVIASKDDNGKWSSPKPISQFINSSGHEASVNLTADGQTLIVYRDDNGDGNLYFSTWDGKDWSSLQQFGSDINSKYWETHACLSADNNTLYFVSDRPGGYGGRDIYRCVKLPNGKWSKALNVGPTINTKYDEDGPFIHPDGVTLFFASNGHKTMGGFDVFVSIIEEDRKFSEPSNIGYPINTTDDDVFFVFSPDGKRGYFSSANDKGYGEKDIYTMFIPETKVTPLALFKGSIIPADGEKLPDNLSIIVTDKETGELVGKYKPRENGSFATILPPNRNYSFSYQNNDEEFYNEDLFVSSEVTYQEIKKEINLDPVALLGKVKVRDRSAILNTIVFNNSKDKQPVANAKVTLTEKGGAVSSYEVDANGKKDGTKLAFEKSYTIFAEADGKKSAVNSFNTIGLKGGKSVTQVIYIDGKPAKSYEPKGETIRDKAEKIVDLHLNVVAVNKKRKPLANTKITLTGNDGSTYEETTDDKGRIKNIQLNKGVNYDLVGENNGVTSDKVLFTTMNVKAKKVYEKKVIIDINPNPVASTTNEGKNADRSNKNNANTSNEKIDVACGLSISYKHYFSYNKNAIDENEDWNVLIDAIISKMKECDPLVRILSSASHVPTKAFSNNRQLAKSRAEKLEEKIKAAVTAKGGDASRIVFSKHWAVRGPHYQGDYKKRSKYGKFQYVKIITK